MSEGTDLIQFRFYLDVARFYYQQMELNFQDATKFKYYLLAFLPIARSVTLVFKRQFHDKKKIMAWYFIKGKELDNNKIMKFFKEMRNVAVHERTPETRSTSEIKWGTDFIIGNPPPVEIERTKDGKEIWRGELPIKGSKVIEYSFSELPEWFDENPDVMYLCSKYLDELQKFVTEAENLMKQQL